MVAGFDVRRRLHGYCLENGQIYDDSSLLDVYRAPEIVRLLSIQI